MEAQQSVQQGGRKVRLRESCDDRTTEKILRCYAAGFEDRGRDHEPKDVDDL